VSAAGGVQASSVSNSSASSSDDVMLSVSACESVSPSDDDDAVLPHVSESRASLDSHDVSSRVGAETQ